MDKDTEKTEPETRFTKEMLQRKEALEVARGIVENRASAVLGSSSRTVDVEDLLRVANYILRGLVGPLTGKKS